MFGLKLNYANVTATVALFFALSGASYAATHLGSKSVGTAQLKSEAVSTAKIRSGAVTSPKLSTGAVDERALADGSVTASKIRDGAVTGAKVDAGTLGTVPTSVHAAQADHAASADHAGGADNAAVAKEAEQLNGFQATSFGPFLTAHTEIPATNTDADWWVPVSGLGQASPDDNDVQMILPGSPRFFAAELVAFSRVGPGPSDAAKVEVQLEDFREPVGPAIPLTRQNAWNWISSSGDSLVGELAIHVSEEANGEEIPALELQTAVRLMPIE